jgi:hypothetical protein
MIRMAAARIPHPHWPGAAARMSDGRLFTDYRANCSLLAPKPAGNVWADYDRRAQMIRMGPTQVASDRQLTALRAAPVAGSCVDTMVPELRKRVYAWNGPIEDGIAHPAGLGTGRLYLPGQPALVGADPDVVASETFPRAMLPGTFEPVGAAGLYGQPVAGPATVGPARHNRYAAPYGN